MTASATELLALLGDATRRGVIETLAHSQASAGELAESLHTTPAALTRHLRLLRQAGVVSAALDPDDNRKHVYRIHPEPFQDLREWADDVAAFWSDQLSAFTKHAASAVRHESRARR